MTAQFKPSGRIKTNFVSGDMPTHKRNKNLFSLGQVKMNQRYVLSNARCLSEGVDVPALDGVAFIDPKNSEIDIIQAVGRAIRLSKDKKIGTIVLPVFIENNEDPEVAINSSEFKKIWWVINALRSHDELLGEQLEELRYELGKRGTVGRVDKISFDLPTSITNHFEESLQLKLIESTTESWSFWFGLLENYKEEHGDCLVPLRYVSNSGHKLGRWVSWQRLKKDILTTKRIEILDNLGFEWNHLDSKWQKGLDELDKYKKEFGDSLVPLRYVSKSGYKLGSWVGHVRRKKSELNPERLKQVNDLGFIWDTKEAYWQEGFDELTTYKRRYGNCEVPRPFVSESGFKLGVWVASQRAKKNKITDKRINLLNNLGFVWGQLELQWQRGLNELETYKKTFGNCLVPSRYISDSGYKLGSWVGHSRRKKSELIPEKLKQLNDLGFVWSQKEIQWQEGLDELDKYKKEFGDSLVPLRYVSESGYKLGSWVSTQRRNKDKLTSERINSLKKLDFIWNARR